MDSKRISTSAVILLVLVALSAAAAGRATSTYVHQLTLPPAGSGDSNPSFSPDGSKIAFARYQPAPPGTAQYSIYIADTHTAAVTLLVPASELPPGFQPPSGIEWSPDGSKLAIVSDTDRQSIWLVELTGPTSAKSPTWSNVKSRYAK